MNLEQVNSFKQLNSIKPENNETKTEKQQLLCEILGTSYKNEIWIGLILDFLNDNDENKEYKEYYLKPYGSLGTRKYTYRFISTDKNMPCSISDDDISVLKRLNAQPKFILYDYQEKPNKDPFAYLENERNLIDILQIIGMKEELSKYLCEYCFNKLKKEKSNEQEQNSPKLVKTKKQ